MKRSRRKEIKTMTSKNKQEKSKMMVRIICIVLAVVLVASTLLAALGIFG